MSTSATTGFCRVTVVAPDSRIDVALPEDVPLADVYPEVLRLSGQTQPDGAPTGFHLVRRDGTVLDSGLPLAAQQVRDGDLLSLRPFAESLPPAVYDDVADAIASAVEADRRFWSPELMRAFGLIGAAVLLTLLGFALWFSDLRHDMHSLPGILSGVTAVMLTALAGVRARVYQDAWAALALGLGALPHAMIGGSGIIAPAHAWDGPGGSSSSPAASPPWSSPCCWWACCPRRTRCSSPPPSWPPPALSPPSPPCCCPAPRPATSPPSPASPPPP